MPPIFSKLLSGGLSAAVVLLWYPLLFPIDSIESWLIRGVLMTLLYEVLLYGLSPLERALWETSQAKQLRAGAARFARPEQRLRHRSVLAVAAVALPIALLGLAPEHPLSRPTGHKTDVRHVTEVKRVVKVERRTVAVAAKPTTTATPAPAPRYAPVATHQTAPPSKRPRRTRHASPTRATDENTQTPDTTGSTDTTPTTPATSDSSTPSTTTQQPANSADTTAQPQPRVFAPSRIA